MSTITSSGKTKQYSMVRYWRYVFTPLLLFGVLLGLVLLFTAPDSQTATYNSLNKRISTNILPRGVSGFVSNITQNLPNAQLDPSAL